MAALKEKSLSRGYLTGTERDTFSKRREHSIKKRPVLLQSDFSTLQSHQHLRAMQLQQRWQELRERELTAQQHNRQLLQRFEEAQDTLREMLTLTAAMKTIRTEYERYLEESSPRWQQQLKEKTKAAQRKRMEAYLRSCLKKADERVAKSSADPPLFSQGPTAKSQNSHMGYNQDGSLPLPYVQPSWQTNPQSQMAQFPIRALHQPQGSPHVPPSFPPPPTHPQPHPFHLTSTPAHPHPWPRQDPPGWAPPQPDYPWSWTAGAAGIPSGPEALWDPPEGRVSQVVREEGESSRAPGSRRQSGGGSSGRHFSQELDIKPVRLSGGPAESSESSESSRESSREERKKREKRGRPQRTSSDRERRSSQESSRTSSAVVTAALAVAQSSESDTSSEKGRSSLKRRRRRRRCGGLGVGSPGAEKVVKDGTRSERDDSEESRPAGEEVRSPHQDSSSEKAAEGSPDDKSESCRGESGSGGVSTKTENGDEIEEEQESSSSEHSSAGEKSEEDEEHERDDRDAEEKEQEEGDVKDEAPESKNTTEEEEETEAEDETEEQKSEEEGDRDGENGKRGSASSLDEEADEDVSEGGGGQTEEDEEEEGGVEEEERDSEDSIISPQKPRKMHVIPEEAGEDEEEEEEEEGRKTGSSDDDFSNEDIEHLLAPQAGSQRKEDKDQRADEKPKAVCDNVGIFQVEQDRSTAPHHQSDSDEFDHFYD